MSNTNIDKKPLLVLDATSKLAGYVREPRSDPIPEIQGDVFDRQRVIEGWNQEKIEGSVHPIYSLHFSMEYNLQPFS